ncbi:MAG: hypothetical protein AVDCRST_MAG20-2654 [uncultured Acidimicrobiales bacterium]|uniref:RNA-binding protein n=1 Tax=uncultured Acidimicrobiales bacterium TaxID=310071 RepID=A0A6J4ITT4_9ACTN|nr:MAG: hypothetical protein AVDCRST_MAG20-2654 [uncultured Acidimicrobiales bacterium]
MTAWLIDGSNVVGSRPDGWWRDRNAAFGRLVTRLGVLAARGDDVSVVFDGRPSDALGEGVHDGVEVLWARRAGPDAADDRIVELVSAHPEPSERCVVTSDRALASRVTSLGAEVMGAGTLLRLLDELEGGRPARPTRREAR